MSILSVVAGARNKKPPRKRGVTGERKLALSKKQLAGAEGHSLILHPTKDLSIAGATNVILCGRTQVILQTRVAPPRGTRDRWRGHDDQATQVTRPPLLRAVARRSA